MNQLSSDDRLAIAEVLARYCHAIDQRRWEDFDELFTDDCRLDFGAVMGAFEGRDGLARFKQTIEATGVFMRHYTTNVVLHGDGARVRAESYVLAITGPADGRMQTTGRYDDDLLKAGGRWRIRARRATIEL